MYISNGTSSAAGRSTNAKVAAGSMKRRINHADAMRSTPGRGRVTQRRFENVFADENAEAAKLAETQRRRRGDAEPRSAEPAQTSGDVQKAQRRAAIATSLRHSGHFLVVGSGGASPRRIRATIVFTGSTTKKYTARAIIRNAISAFRKSPTSSLLPLTVSVNS